MEATLGQGATVSISVSSSYTHGRASKSLDSLRKDTDLGRKGGGLGSGKGHGGPVCTWFVYMERTLGQGATVSYSVTSSYTHDGESTGLDSLRKDTDLGRKRWWARQWERTCGGNVCA
jgi:hypothetical protein